MKSARPHGSGRDCPVDLMLPDGTKERPYCGHEVDRFSAFDDGRVRHLVVGLAGTHWNDRAIEEASDTLDDVSVGHENADESTCRRRRRRRDERAFAFEDACQPMKGELFYRPSCALNERRCQWDPAVDAIADQGG